MTLDGAYPREGEQHGEVRPSIKRHPVKIQRSKSLVPPKIVELNSSRVVLSWRITRGSCSIRTDVEVEPINNQEWANLEKDSKPNSRHYPGKENSHVTSRVEQVEVDHVELQTCCCGCPQCVRGDEDVCIEGQPAAGCSCPFCPPVHGGLGCWRPVYQGSDCQCQVKLEPGNTLHYFRLLARACIPPPERRGFRRPKCQDSPGAKIREHNRPNQWGCFGTIFPQKPSKWRRRHRPQGQVGLASDNCDNSNDEALSPVSPTYCDYYREAQVVGIMAAEHEQEKEGLEGMATMPSEDNIVGTKKPVQWFSSAPVFVDSRPPLVSLHGIGTALVLTWPPLFKFSGSEQVSYIVEQWSHDASPVAWRGGGFAASSLAWAATTTTIGGGDSRRSKQQRTRGQSSRQDRRRHHHHHHNFPRPKQPNVKEVFSVGKRCWFVPTSLKADTRYWYRLRLLHEGGRSVGGPWTSHLTSPTPPRCIDACSRALVLSLPRTIDESSTTTSRKRVGGGAYRRAEKCNSSISSIGGSKGVGIRKQELFTPARSSGCLSGEGVGIIERPGIDVSNGEGEYSFREKKDKNEEEEENDMHSPEPETPVVWYTLEGLEAGSRWAELHRGCNSKVVVEGLQASTLTAFRVGVDVDMTELRRRSIGPLASLELEPRAPHESSASPAAVPSADGLTIATRPKSRTLRRGNSGGLTQPESFVQPALTLKNGAIAPNLLTAFPFVTDKFDQRPWNPATSPVMSQMKREGFAVHDAAATIGGGVYVEPPQLLLSPERLQDPSSVRTAWDNDNRAGVEGSTDCNVAAGWQYRNYSEHIAFGTAPLPPRYAAFIVGGAQQVKMWWAAPQNTSATPLPTNYHPHAEAAAIDQPTQSVQYYVPEHGGSCLQGRTPRTTGTKARQAEGENAAGASGPSHYPSFVLSVLDPVSRGMQLVHSGMERWTELGRSWSNGVSLAPSTAYFVNLSATMTATQPESVAEGVVITAPPAPALELVERGGEGEGGMVTLKAFWTTDVDSCFLPAGENPPPFSIALEMAHVLEAGSPTRGLGCTLRPAPRIASGRSALASPRGSTAVVTPAVEEEGVVLLSESLTLAGGVHSVNVTEEISVRKDADGGQCWTLSSSSWGKPGCPGGDFRVVWMGFGGETEAFTPQLPPGMRFAFRVRLECCFGVAISATTVYQTAPMVPLPPKALRAGLASHESRAGKTSRCVKLSWGPSDPGHGKNVVTSFTVQARRARLNSEDGPRHDDKHYCIENAWQHICSCPDTDCLDPETLGVTHVVADYRVRAHGPGGAGPWCEPLRVNFPAVTHNKGSNIIDGGSPSTERKVFVGGGTTEEDDEEQRRPMAYIRPGTGKRNPLTGEVGRPWSARRPLQMSSPSAAVAMAAVDNRYRRAGGSKQLLWGALASPRASRGCRMASSTAVSGSDKTSWTPVLCGYDKGGVLDGKGRGDGLVDSNNSTESEVEPTEVAAVVGRSSTAVDTINSDVADVVEVDVPEELKLILREDMGVSRKSGCGAAGSWVGMGKQNQDLRGRAVDRSGASTDLTIERLLRRNPGCPVVTWNYPQPHLHAGVGGSTVEQEVGREKSCRPRRPVSMNRARRRGESSIGEGCGKYRRPRSGRLRKGIGGCKNDSSTNQGVVRGHREKKMAWWGVTSLGDGLDGGGGSGTVGEEDASTLAVHG